MNFNRTNCVPFFLFNFIIFQGISSPTIIPMYAEKTCPLFWNGILFSMHTDIQVISVSDFFSAKRADPDEMPNPEMKILLWNVLLF